MQGIFWPAEWMLAFQGLYSVELGGSFYSFYLMKTEDANIFHCFPEYGAPEEEEYTTKKVTLNKNLLSILSKFHTPHMF